MVDITITAGSVVPGANAVIDRNGTAGEAITAGMPVYKDASTKKYKKADNNSATAAVRQPLGISLNGASDGQPIAVQTAGDITIGATITAGTAYYLSDTAGGICPLADVGAAEYVCLLGLAKSTTVLALDIQYPGVALEAVAWVTFTRDFHWHPRAAVTVAYRAGETRNVPRRCAAAARSLRAAVPAPPRKACYADHHQGR